MDGGSVNLATFHALITEHAKATGEHPTKATLSPQDAADLRAAVVVSDILLWGIGFAPQQVVMGIRIEVSASVTTPVLS